MALAFGGVLVAHAIRPKGHLHGGGYCMRNLRQIGIGLHVHAYEHRGVLPPSLGALFPTYVMDGEAFRCTAAADPFDAITREDLPRGAEDASAVFAPKHTHYEYVAGFRSDDPDDILCAFDRSGNHRDGRNALFLDGHVEWVSETSFRELLKKSVEYLRAQGRPAPALTE